MKNFILSFIAFTLSFGLTTFGLKSYLGGKSLFDIITTNTPKVVNKQVEKTSSNNKFDRDNTEESINENVTTEFISKVNIDEITSDYKIWKKYNKENIELSNNFVAINVNNTEIEKEDFLSNLKKGLYIPVEVESDNITYKLIELKDDEISKKIGRSQRNIASVAYDYFKKEGTELPKFDWVDLEGNQYTSSSTKGKIKVIKCWFINCVVCVQEFPELNEIYDFYEGNDQIQFLSLAFDEAEKLKKFLSKKEFRFPVISKQRNYMSKELEVKLYPTHVIVDQDNNIIKMVTNVKALKSFLTQFVDNNSDLDEEEEEIDTQF